MLSIFISALALFASIVDARFVAGVFKSIDSITFDNKANAPTRAPWSPNWIVTASWNLDSAKGVAIGDWFKLIMPCVYAVQQESLTLELTVDGTAYASCSVLSGNFLRAESELFCVVLPSFGKNNVYSGKITFPVTFNAGGNGQLWTGINCGHVFSTGPTSLIGSVTWNDAVTTLTCDVDFEAGNQYTDPENGVIFNRYIFTRKQNELYLLAGFCPRGYTYVTLGMKVSTTFDYSTLTQGLEDVLNAFYLPIQTIILTGSEVIRASNSEFKLTMNYVGAGWKPMIGITAETADELTVDYLNTYVCMGSTDVIDNSISRKWKAPPIEYPEFYLATVVVSSINGPGVTTVVSTSSTAQTPTGLTATRTVFVKIPTGTESASISYSSLSDDPSISKSTASSSSSVESKSESKSTASSSSSVESKSESKSTASSSSSVESKSESKSTASSSSSAESKSESKSTASSSSSAESKSQSRSIYSASSSDTPSVKPTTFVTTFTTTDANGRPVTRTGVVIVGFNADGSPFTTTSIQGNPTDCPACTSYTTTITTTDSNGKPTTRTGVVVIGTNSDGSLYTTTSIQGNPTDCPACTSYTTTITTTDSNGKPTTRTGVVVIGTNSDGSIFTKTSDVGPSLTENSVTKTKTTTKIVCPVCTSYTTTITTTNAKGEPWTDTCVVVVETNKEGSTITKTSVVEKTKTVCPVCTSYTTTITTTNAKGEPWTDTCVVVVETNKEGSTITKTTTPVQGSTVIKSSTTVAGPSTSGSQSTNTPTVLPNPNIAGIQSANSFVLAIASVLFFMMY
jgi:transposase-like protein